MRDEIIKNLLRERPGGSKVFLRNVVREYLQILALSYIYSHQKHRNLIFYGGSCLKHCFGINRLSEDLDFVSLEKDYALDTLARELTDFFWKKLEVKITTKVQKFRIYLKFPVLYDLGLEEPGGPDYLYIKVEVFEQFDFCKDYKIEIAAVFKFNESMLIRRLDLPTLMASKIRAILQRHWKKVDKEGRGLAKVKGRDYFDLMWYLEKGVQPNLKCVGEDEDREGLKNRLLTNIKELDPASIKLDLGALIEDQNLVDDLARNLKEILTREVNEKL